MGKIQRKNNAIKRYVSERKGKEKRVTEKQTQGENERENRMKNERLR